MANQVTGFIKAISKQETMMSKSGTSFTKQSIFLDNGSYDQETGEHYDNNLLLDFINYKNGDIAQSFKAGDKVTITFRLRSRQWVNKEGKTEYGISVSCYRIEPFATQPMQQPVQQVQQPQMQIQQQAMQPQQVFQQPAPAANDLPF